jgi:uncharacterized protein
MNFGTLRLLGLALAVIASFASATHAQSATNSAANVLAEAVAAYDGKNYRDALRLFRPLAEKGNPEAQYYIGRMYEKGQGVSKDKAQTIYWYRKSAEGGYAKSQYRLAVGYAFGLAGLPTDDEEAVKWLHKSAEGGYQRAQKNLSRAYAEGRFGLPKDQIKAAYWAKKAEEQN